MTKFIRVHLHAIWLGLPLLLIACAKENRNEQPVFDRTPMLQNYASSVILPRYEAYRNAALQLHSSALHFAQTPTVQCLDSLRSTFVAAYLSYQSIAPFEFGPAETIQLRANTNIFPTDTTQILSNVAQASIDLGLAENADAKGFPALDFLLFRRLADSDLVLDSFINQPFLFTYVSTLTQRIASDASDLVEQWSNAYATTFIDANGTDMASSTSYLVNQINYELDLLKNAKFAIPMGLQTLNIAQPQKSEGLFCKKSLDLAKHSLMAIKQVYLGSDTLLNNGLGLDDYLASLPLDGGNGNLHASIMAKFAAAETALDAINAPIDTAVIENQTAVQAAYSALVQLLVLLKTDLPSQLGIVINYQDGDGD